MSETKTQFYDFFDSLLEDFTLLTSEKDNLDSNFATHGMCILVRKSIAEHLQLVKGMQSKQTIWVKIKPDLVGVEFILGSIYLPCESSTFYDLQQYF